MNVLNPVGEFLKQLQKESGERGKDMAKKLRIDPQYLSNVCNGLKRCPDHWDELVADRYELSEEKRREWYGAIAISNHNLQFIYEKLNDDDKKIVLTLANFVDAMHPKQKKKIMDVINNGWI